MLENESMDVAPLFRIFGQSLQPSFRLYRKGKNSDEMPQGGRTKDYMETGRSLFEPHHPIPFEV